jgi:hypothetical protein
MGKLRTAIRMLLLLAFEAIPEIKLKAAEKPKDDRRSVSIKIAGSLTGLLMNREKRRKPVSDKTRHNAVL